MPPFKKVSMTADEAETLAIRGLTFLGTDPQRLSRFFALTGSQPGELRVLAADAAFLSAVIEYFLADESLLLVAASDLGVAPEAFATAHEILTKVQSRG